MGKERERERMWMLGGVMVWELECGSCSVEVNFVLLLSFFLSYKRHNLAFLAL